MSRSFTINLPDGSSCEVFGNKSKRATDIFFYLLACIRWGHKHTTFKVKETADVIEVFEAHLPFAGLHKLPSGLRYWSYPAFQVPGFIIIHDKLNKYEMIAVLTHEIMHKLYGDDEA
ncbi:hypothetical protein KY325_04525, partial [Candidatus Woesearchaeota archaeon]|nr:hypothetical protein [Candidatus Woesearchaeota archaeon]